MFLCSLKKHPIANSFNSFETLFFDFCFHLVKQEAVFVRIIRLLLFKRTIIEVPHLKKTINTHHVLYHVTLQLNRRARGNRTHAY